MSMSLNFLGGAPFQLLYDGVRVAIGRTTKFKALLLNLESTLDCLQPRVIQQIRDHNVELNLPNDIIQDLQVKMDDGVALIANLSRLSVWNCRVWGDCCNCMKPSYADQLAALDRSLRRLLEILKLEQMRNVVELLLLARRSNDRQDDLERRQLEILKALQETGDMLRAQQEVMERIERNGAASSDRGGSAPAPAPALGTVFRVLFDVVIRVKVKNMMYERILKDFESTLECLKPLIEEMVESNKLLHLSNEEQEYFIMQMEKGVELIHQCSEACKRGIRYKKYEYTKKLLGLDACLQRLFIELKEQVVRNVKEALVLISNLEKEITEIEGVVVVQSDEIECSIPAPQPRSPLVGEDLQNVQINQEVIEALCPPLVLCGFINQGLRATATAPAPAFVFIENQEVIEETFDAVSNLEEEIKEIREVHVVQNNEVQSKGPQPSLPTAGSSVQSMQGTRDVIKERWDSEKLPDVKQIKGKGLFEYPVTGEYELPPFPVGLAQEREDHADAFSNASLEEPVDELDMHVSYLKRKLLHGGHLAIVLTGPEGCGKTRLAEKFCQDEEVIDEFKNNIFFVPVSESPKLQLIVQKLYPEEGYRKIMLPDENGVHAIQWLQAFVKHVGHHRSLLVLDDVWPGSESLLDEFDEFKRSNFKILVTSRFEFPRFGSSYYAMTDDILRVGR
ncbi:putative powdery mildew resistance protein, RPW8 [Rosa chinensis]|uniref:Putative powdery mildew resistance protein, RPW8 n=1 Tax=Rosa chinensis TaxID=74649 RepID=A0A2P6P402_ROSCH|nr:uncharacterized protein LOC112175944 [Rosa chinensis]PRQ16664.1 putative powdery mildew resistance protein, RPW8 [Rosa chinensis]